MKKIIALISAAAMMLSMAVVASAKTEPKADGFSVVFNAAESTVDTAVIEIYGKGFDGKEVTALKVQADLNTTNFGSLLSTEKNFTKGDPQVNIGRGKLVMTGSDVNGFAWDASKPMVKVKVQIKSALTAKHNLKISAANQVVDGVTSSDIKANVQTDDVLPMTATVAGTTVAEDANSDAATWFKVETTGVSGATPYWYATVDGAAKKVAFTDANVEGTVTVGLVSTGSVSNAKVVWE